MRLVIIKQYQISAATIEGERDREKEKMRSRGIYFMFSLQCYCCIPDSVSPQFSLLFLDRTYLGTPKTSSGMACSS